MLHMGEKLLESRHQLGLVTIIFVPNVRIEMFVLGENDVGIHAAHVQLAEDDQEQLHILSAGHEVLRMPLLGLKAHEAYVQQQTECLRFTLCTCMIPSCLQACKATRA